MMAGFLGIQQNHKKSFSDFISKKVTSVFFFFHNLFLSEHCIEQLLNLFLANENKNETRNIIPNRPLDH